MTRALFSNLFFPYHFFVVMTLIMVGVIVNHFLQKPLLIFMIMAVAYVFLTLILLHLFYQQVKLFQRTIKNVEHLAQGNYNIRLDYQVHDHFVELNHKFNQLARNLRTLALEKQIQTEQLSTVIDHIESALILIDEKGYIHLVNETFLRMFGDEQISFIGQLYYKVLHEDIIHKIILETFSSEENRKKSFSYKDREGIAYYELVSAPIMNERNILKGVVLVFYNITELKKLEFMRKDFVANVSHELKTPITSIRGFSETLLDGAIHDPAVSEKFLKIIHDESKRLQTLIDHLLSLTKLEQDVPKLHMEKTNLQLLFGEISPLIEQMVEEKSITFTAQFEGNLILYGDQEKLKQVFINLFTNAVHYTPENGVITFLAKRENAHVLIQINDTGIGISTEDLPRIFERFYRVDKARSRNTGGTGLGLSIVKHIVEGHGGNITITSKVNHGTTVNIRLPTKLLDEPSLD